MVVLPFLMVGINNQVDLLLNNENLQQCVMTEESQLTKKENYSALDRDDNLVQSNSVLHIINTIQNTNDVYGGYCVTPNCNVENTNVIMKDGAVNNIYGTSVLYESFDRSLISKIASGNVYLMGGAINGNIYGASVSSYSSVSTIANGNVYLMGGIISGNIYGASASTYSITRDNANLNSGFYSKASGNVYLFGDIKLQYDHDNVTEYNSSIWGGYSDNLSYYHNIFNDNLLSIASTPLTVKNVGNFATYQFYFNQYNAEAIAEGTALLTVKNAIQNNNTIEENIGVIKNSSTVQVGGISVDGIVSKGSVITLIDASGSNVSFIQGDSVDNISVLFKTKEGDKETGIKVGLVGKADVTYHVDSTKNIITATVDDYRKNPDDVDTNVKPLAEGRLVALENVTRGADMLFDVMGENKEVGTFTPIAAMSGGVNKYNSGSHIDTRDYRLMVGSRYQLFDNLYVGLTAEYGRSNYDTYNDGDIHGSGHTYNYGASLFTKLSSRLDTGNDIYMEGVIRLGRTSTMFDSSDIITGRGDMAHYKSKANYTGVNLATGFIYNIDATNSVETSIRYLWTHLNGDSVVLDGDKVNFEKTDSTRIQLKEQYNYRSSDNLVFSLAGIYEYEFNSETQANVSGISIDAPSVKGSTGIIELSMKGTPIADNKDLTVYLSFKGYGGKRNGASASAFIEYDF